MPAEFEPHAGAWMIWPERPDNWRAGAVPAQKAYAAVAVILAGLLPIMWGSGTGSEVMQRIAATLVGGMITAPLMSMFVIPVAYLVLRRRQLR